MRNVLRPAVAWAPPLGRRHAASRSGSRSAGAASVAAASIIEPDSAKGSASAKAVLAFGQQDYAWSRSSELDESPQTRPLKKGEMRMQVGACSICASDVKMFQGSQGERHDCFFWGKHGRVQSVPVIPGHEFVGTIEEIYDDPDGTHSVFSVGDRVVAETQVSCGKCWFCTSGAKHKCDSLQIFGQGVDGGMATHAVIPPGGILHRVPDEVSMYDATFAEPLSVGLRGIARANITAGGADQLLVVGGCGSIGLAIIAGLQTLAPLATVVAVDMNPRRLEVARQCGAHVTVRPNEGDLGALMRELAPAKRGCDVYFEAAGNHASVANGLELLRKCGTMVTLGIMNAHQAQNWNLITAVKELTVVGSSLGHGSFPLALRLLAGHGKKPLPMDQIITHVLPMGAFLEGYELLTSANGEDPIKVVLDPWLAEPIQQPRARRPEEQSQRRPGGKAVASREEKAPAAAQPLSAEATATGAGPRGLGAIVAAADGVPQVRLADGALMPAIGVGTFFGSEAPAGVVEGALRTALGLGYRHVDTAEKYGVLEEVGNALAAAGAPRRQDLYLSSKLWQTNHAPEHVRPAVERQLALLRTDYLDQLLVHWPVAWRHTGIAFDGPGGFFPMRKARGPGGAEERDTVNVSMQETWSAMEGLVKDGLVRSIGVSNMTAVMLHDLLCSASIPPATNQVELHLGFPQSDLVAFCAAQGVQPVAYSPLGRPGLLEPGQVNWLEHETLQAIAARHQRSPGQVCLRWHLQRGVAVVPKSASEERLRGNLRVMDFELDNEEMQALDALSAGKQKRLLQLDFCFDGGGFSLK